MGIRAVREFLGALTDSGIAEGIFVTVRGYTGEAEEFAGKHRIEILDRAELLGLVRSSGAAEDPQVMEILSDRRKFCPKCESEMVLRTATRGPGAGEQFWGCSAFPRCHYTMEVTGGDAER